MDFIIPLSKANEIRVLNKVLPPLNNSFFVLYKITSKWKGTLLFVFVFSLKYKNTKKAVTDEKGTVVVKEWLNLRS